MMPLILQKGGERGKGRHGGAPAPGPGGLAVARPTMTELGAGDNSQ
jgi:hypothetical protein